MRDLGLKFILIVFFIFVGKYLSLIRRAEQSGDIITNMFYIYVINSLESIIKFTIILRFMRH